MQIRYTHQQSRVCGQGIVNLAERVDVVCNVGVDIQRYARILQNQYMPSAMFVIIHDIRDADGRSQFR